MVTYLFIKLFTIPFCTAEGPQIGAYDGGGDKYTLGSGPFVPVNSVVLNW